VKEFWKLVCVCWVMIKTVAAQHQGGVPGQMSFLKIYALAVTLAEICIIFAKSIHWMTTTLTCLALITTCHDRSVLTALRRHWIENQVSVCSLVLLPKICDYSARSQASAKYWIHFTARFGGVHAPGYNSTESESIWMKSGALLSTLLGVGPGRFWAWMHEVNSLCTDS